MLTAATATTAARVGKNCERVSFYFVSCFPENLKPKMEMFILGPNGNGKR